MELSHVFVGEYRPKWFRWLAWDYDLKQAIGRDLAALSPFADGVLAVWLDPQTLHWWRTRIGRRRSARVRLIHWLASRYWLYAAGAGVGAWWADVDLPRWALALLIVTAMLGLLVDLSPAILPFIRLLGRSAGLRRGLRALLLVAGFILTFVLPARWGGVGPAAVFVALVTLLRDEHEFSVYLSTTLSVAFGLGIAARLAGWTQIPFDWAILAGLTAAWAAVAWRRRRVAAVK